MKTLIVMLAAAFIDFTAVAQQDTSVFKKDSPVPSQPVSPSQPTPPARIQDKYTQPDRVPVTQEQLPQAMRLALQDNLYRGWENSSIYQDRTTGEYTLEMPGSNQTFKVYRFDRNGRLLEDPNKPQKDIDQEE